MWFRRPGNSFGASPLRHQPKFARPACLPGRVGRETLGQRGAPAGHAYPACPPARPFLACHQAGGTAAEPRPARRWAKPSARPPAGTLEPGRHSRRARGRMPRANAACGLPGLPARATHWPLRPRHCPRAKAGRGLPGLPAPPTSPASAGTLSPGAPADAPGERQSKFTRPSAPASALGRDALAGGHPRARVSLPKSTESAKTLTAGRCPGRTPRPEHYPAAETPPARTPAEVCLRPSGARATTSRSRPPIGRGTRIGPASPPGQHCPLRPRHCRRARRRMPRANASRRSPGLHARRRYPSRRPGSRAPSS